MRQIDLDKKKKDTRKYTPEQEQMLKEDYEDCETDEERKEVINNYVEEWGKTERSIIAKLSKMGIYVTKERVSKTTGEKPATKEQLVEELELLGKQKKGAFTGLEKAPKTVLVILKSLLK